MGSVQIVQSANDEGNQYYHLYCIQFSQEFKGFYLGPESTRISVEALFYRFLSLPLMMEIVEAVCTITIEAKFAVGKTITIPGKKFENLHLVTF